MLATPHAWGRAAGQNVPRCGSGVGQQRDASQGRCKGLEMKDLDITVAISSEMKGQTFQNE